MTGQPRGPCGAKEARVRLRTAEAYLETAELVLGEARRREFSNVAAGLAVLAGIAASDAVCCMRLRSRHRGSDHRGAISLLEEATPDGKDVAASLTRLLNVKDTAHYGVSLIDARTARKLRLCVGPGDWSNSPRGTPTLMARSGRNPPKDPPVGGSLVAPGARTRHLGIKSPLLYPMS